MSAEDQDMIPRRAQAVVVCGSALGVLVALYLPWRVASRPEAPSANSLLDLGDPLGVSDAWHLAAGPLACLAAIAVIARSVGLFRTVDGRSSPPVAALAGWLALTVAAGLIEARESDRLRALGDKHVAFHYASGAYVAVCAASIGLGIAVASRPVGSGERKIGRQTAATIASSLIFLASLLLPWHHVFVSKTFSWTATGIRGPAACAAGVLALAALASTNLRVTPLARVAVNATITLLVVAELVPRARSVSPAYGAWIGLGATVVLLAASLPGFASTLTRASRPRRFDLTDVGAVLVIAAAVLPWQRACDPEHFCATTPSSSTVLGAVAALLALGLLLRRALRLPTPALATAIAVLTATLGFQLVGGPGVSASYGAYVGFGAAALCLLGAIRSMTTKAAWSRAELVALVPVVVTIAYVAVLVVPWWSILPAETEAALRSGGPSWLSVTSLVIALLVAAGWIARFAGRAADRDTEALLPLALTALAVPPSVELLLLHGFTWGAGLVTALPLALAAAALIDVRTGLANLRVPELFRVDRL